MELVREVEQTIRSERLLNEEDGITVAVSGGPDSVAMLHILFLLSAKWRWRLVVAHVDHRFRGAESAAEAEFVRAFADRLGLPCEVAEIDVPAYIRETGMNPQAAAREKRYEFLADTAARYGCGRIATAHHADDQAETIVMRFLRGTGAAGLAGIPFVRPLKNMQLVRPFLRITKGELLTYSRRHELPFCEDSSNRKLDYTRNRVRQELIPLMRQYNPRLSESLSRMADTFREEEAYLEEQTRAAFAKLAAAAPGGYRFSAAEFGRLPVALQRRFVKLILVYLCPDGEKVDFAAVETIREAVTQTQTSSLSLDAGAGMTLVKEYDRAAIVISSDVTAPEGGYTYVWPQEAETLAVSEAGIRLTATFAEPVTGAVNPEKHTVLFDAGLVALPLRIRSRRDGDRMSLFGLNGRKKVKDIFIDAKVPPSERDRIPLVFDAADRLLWIPGIRRSAEAPVTADTKCSLELRIHPLNEGHASHGIGPPSPFRKSPS